MAVAVINNNDMLISSSAFSTSASRVEVRSVWAHNLDEEFALIRSVVPFHPFVALDTEYPGVVVASKNPYCTLTLSQRYELIRANVEALRIVQVGLTLSDAAGNLPCAIYSDGTCVRYVWEFNFRDFDISRDRYAPSSVELLKANGIDFQKNQVWGIDSCRFAQHLATSGLLSFGHFSPVSWVTFQGAYDFAFLVKMLTCDCKLPMTVREFLHLVHFFFGKRVFDVKHLCKHCPGLHGGLERVASTVRVERAVGSRHQSGSDSLLTWQVFYQIASRVNPQLIHRPEHMGALFDLQLP
ncbi:probable CCR4-associated factor 1 homolog 11 [Zingiber officinale]|uniref:probable CCR4-associated factor 1 homolog 11 n=1 Tax=Zingiber officinale TaxID=94328 RepID=UPI001C4B901A|nr:probable CCR4-associated factor 1 homolog 11 [Zingiber officinale]